MRSFVHVCWYLTEVLGRHSKLFCWCVREWHILHAILLLRRYIAVFILVDHVDMLLEITAGIGLLFDRYEQPSEEAS